MTEYEVLIKCLTYDYDSKGFNIFIDGRLINENIPIHYVRTFECKTKCMSKVKYHIKVEQKNIFNSRWWFVVPIISFAAATFSGYSENFNGPFYAIEEGEFLINNNGQINIDLIKSNALLGTKYDKIKIYDFRVMPDKNCFYKVTMRKNLSSRKIRRRYSIAIIFPILLIGCLVTLLLIPLGIQMLVKGMLFWGLLFFAINLVLIYFAIVSIFNILKIAFMKI